MATPCDLFLDTLANQRRERPRATARVPTPPPNRPRPYHERGGEAVRAVMVGAGEERKWGGDPCGRPRTSKVLGKETLAVAIVIMSLCYSMVSCSRNISSASRAAR